MDLTLIYYHRTRLWWRYIFLIVSTVGFCEFFGDYVTIFKCQWPSANGKISFQENVNSNVVRSILIADTHLLGPFKGHWLDKLYREWHMKQAYQAAMLLHKPDVVFILGDLFDEGEFVDHDEFKKYVQRFHSHFRSPPSTSVISAVGNHDIGFHYKMHPYFVDRFEKQFNNTGVDIYSIRGNHFVFINSMAMENDGCEFCENAKDKLIKIADKLSCLKNAKRCKNIKSIENQVSYSRPIVLQHFPTYRESDKSCREYDAPYIEIYRENWDVLSKNSTDFLGKLLHPRLLFAGHTHHYCYSINRGGIEEYTVSSFNWRNKINPSFLMVSVSPTFHGVHKCDMLEQQLVCYIYTTSLIILISIIVWDYILITKTNTKIN